MKVKVNMLDKKLLSKSYKVSATVFGIVMAVISFFNFNIYINILIMALTTIASIIIHIALYFIANNKVETVLNINNSTLKIYFGNIFDEKEFKLIGFNEYFDTTLEHNIISKTSLNGEYILRNEDLEQLDKNIEENENLIENIIGENKNRKNGKIIKYKLGTIHVEKDYFLMALTKFDDKNNARITMREYVNALIHMWEEIDRYYDGRTVTIPLLGNGITRFKDGPMSAQELLNIIIWTYEISKVKFTYPSKIKIVIHPALKDKINLYNLKI